MGAAMNLFGLRKDGSEFPVDIMLKPIETASGPVVLSFVRDVTEQRAALDALRRNDQYLRSIVESVRDYAIFMQQVRYPSIADVAQQRISAHFNRQWGF